VGRMGSLPLDFFKDITFEYFRLKKRDGQQTIEDASFRTAKEITDRDKCHYHQHNDKHPRCVPGPMLDQHDDSSSE
jgi:hypothetical protein